MRSNDSHRSVKSKDKINLSHRPDSNNRQHAINKSTQSIISDQLRQTSSSNSIHAFSDDALQHHDGVALAMLLRSGEVSSVEVIEAAIQRASKVNIHLNAIEIDCFEVALKKARQSLPHGVFAGVPTFIKDNTEVQGLPTNSGSAALNTAPAKQHGDYARQYLDQGFVVLGKSTLPEFGFNATTEPAHKEATRNPWNIDFSTGASSGGSAALVAAGVVPIAHANDGGGSIRIPAACCGLVGLKPSRGRHLRAKQTKVLPINIVSEGILSRSVRDTAVFHAQAERYYRNPKLRPIGLVEGPGKRRLRIGFALDSITGKPTDYATRGIVENTAQLLQNLGHKIEEIPIPIDPQFAIDFGLYWAFLAAMIKYTSHLTMDRQFDPEKIDGLSKGLSNKFKREFVGLPAAIYRLKKTHSQAEKIFSHYDIVLTPVVGHTTPPLGYLSPTVPFEQLFQRLLHYVCFTPLANTSGTPALSLPMGMTIDNLPIAAQLMSGYGEERTLLEIAFELEQAKPWNTIYSSVKKSESKKSMETA